MPDNIIQIEDQNGPFKDPFRRVMRMVPEKDRRDVNLQRLIAFRLRLDGESATSDYLGRKLREIIQCGYSGSLYAYLKNDLEEKACKPNPPGPDPPDVA